MPLEKLALVTGGAHRIGRAISLHLARRGYAILLHHHASAEQARITAGQVRGLGVAVELIQADLGAGDGLQRLVQAVQTLTDGRGWQLQVLVNSAAIMPPGRIQELSLEDWDRVMALNLRAPFALTRDLVPAMRSGGLVVNISDVGANRLWTGYPAYVISKAALETLTGLQARAYAPGVRVNALALGLVLPPDGMPEETWRSLVSRSPAGRPVTFEEIGAGMDLLLDQTALTGQTIVLDGGNPPSGME